MAILRVARRGFRTMGRLLEKLDHVETLWRTETLTTAVVYNTVVTYLDDIDQLRRARSPWLRFSSLAEAYKRASCFAFVLDCSRRFWFTTFDCYRFVFVASFTPTVVAHFALSFMFHTYPPKSLIGSHHYTSIPHHSHYLKSPLASRHNIYTPPQSLPRHICFEGYRIFGISYISSYFGGVVR